MREHQAQTPSPPLHVPSAACRPSRSTPPAPAAARGSPRRASPPSAAPAPRWRRRRASAAGPAAPAAGQELPKSPGAGGRWRRRPARTWGCAAGLAALGRAAGIAGCGEAQAGEASELCGLKTHVGASARFIQWVVAVRARFWPSVTPKYGEIVSPPAPDSDVYIWHGRIKAALSAKRHFGLGAQLIFQLGQPLPAPSSPQTPPPSGLS